MKPIVVVIGMARSGTSLIAQALERLGVSFGDNLVEGDSANVRGYYEHKDIVNHQTRMIQLHYYRKAWDTIGEFQELPGHKHVEAIEGHLYELGEVLIQGAKANVLFGVKLPLFHRIPVEWGSIFTEVEVEPIYIHAIRDPMETYASIMRANKTEDKAYAEEWWKFLRIWAWANAALFEYEPCEVWYEEWLNEEDAVMKRLADAVGRDTVSTEGLLL